VKRPALPPINGWLTLIVLVVLFLAVEVLAPEVLDGFGDFVVRILGPLGKLIPAIPWPGN
jgi:hypothetical protein